MTLIDLTDEELKQLSESMPALADKAKVVLNRSRKAQITNSLWAKSPRTIQEYQSSFLDDVLVKTLILEYYNLK
jgi:hypothetical protein